MARQIVRVVGVDRLGPWVIEVCEAAPLVDDDDGSPMHGCWDFESRRIMINANDPPDVKAATLLHERIHAISDCYGLGLSEQTVCCLELGLYQCGVR